MNNANTINLDRIIDNNTPKDNPRFDLKYFPRSSLLANTLNEMFPEQTHEDKTLLKAKEILGDKFTIEDIKSMIASYEYLINIWLQEYEKKIFNNRTLRELLQDK